MENIRKDIENLKNKEDFLKKFRNSMLQYANKVINERKEKGGPNIGSVLQERGYLNIFTNADNDKRNSIKKEEIKVTKNLRLHAKSCHAFLARGIVFNEVIKKALSRGMKFKIIMQNPWSLNSLYLSLNREEFESQEQYEDYIKHKMSSEEILKIFEKSHWYTERFSLCIKGYKELKQSFRTKIELRVSDRDASNSLFLSDKYLFFEPYLNTVRAGEKSLSLFEMQVSKSSELYKDSDDYFKSVWESSYSYDFFQRIKIYLKKD